MPRQATTTRRRRGHALIVSGYGVQIHVRHGQLVVSDGIGEARAERVYPRVGHNINRLVVLAQDGSVSLAAMRWLAHLGIPYVHLDRDGRLIAETINVGLNDARLRRAQAFAASSSIGLQISRELITEKIRGQQSNMVDLGRSPEELEAGLDLARDADSLDEVRHAERVAALAYWSAWAGLAMRFHRRDECRVPKRWRCFDHRGSEITGNPRLATDPSNALLNYLYALLEVETTIACRAVGLDPGLGIIHADTPARASLALDVMEAARPAVDRYVIRLLSDRVFAARDFMETAQDVCRVMPPLRDLLASTLPTWSGEVAPHVEAVVVKIAEEAQLPAPSTRLTGQRRRVARPASDRTRRPAPPSPALPSRRCVDCGAEIARNQRRCRDCHRTANDARLVAAGQLEADRRRVSGDHPSSRVEVRQRIATSQRRRWQERLSSAEESGFGTAPSTFRRLVLPGIQGVSSSQLAQATGLSGGYCGLVRRGLRVPHPRHWAAFQLAGLQASDVLRGR